MPRRRRYYSIVSLNFGLITNLDIGTEHMRCAVHACLILKSVAEAQLPLAH